MKLKLQFVLALASAGLFANTANAQNAKASSIEGTTPFGPAKQYRTWSIGIGAGVTNQTNIAGFNRANYEDLAWNLGYSAYIKKQISPSFGIKANYFGGKTGGAFKDGTQSFEAKTPWSAALSGEFQAANTNWRFFNSFIKPYASVGVGVMNSKTTLTTGSTSQEADGISKIYVPLDMGFKFAVAKGINFELGYQLNWVNQNFDGIQGGQYKNDLFTYIHGGLEFALGNGSKPALNNSNPVATLVNDYTLKYDDLKAQNDALNAKNQALQNQLDGLNSDLKDDDGDGVANKYDKCPGTPSGVQVDGAGCPIVVKNETRVVEKVVVTEADRKVVADAIKNLEFDLGKATIRPTSYATLNKVAELLIEKNFSLKLAGHTDNTGSRELNMRLSKERAESVKAYLVSQGANASRIEATGYGPDQPIASNKTADGRQQNRRVEFTLY
ncbi:OmpA family protein [uncultured Sphingobacterium sp.]|uniref:OmpA family protein n=1 Tax=uncultured Sphingobacterium sp. TaxID=182688 RepID=UPI0025FDE46F|nr:OmpA family protein [uncultured Sphingobacterium sp.]